MVLALWFDSPIGHLVILKLMTLGHLIVGGWLEREAFECPFFRPFLDLVVFRLGPIAGDYSPWRAIQGYEVVSGI